MLGIVRMLLELTDVLLSKMWGDWMDEVDWMDSPRDCYDYLGTCGAKNIFYFSGNA